MIKSKLSTELFLSVTGGLIALLGFLAERYEKIVATRVELQTDFYKQWSKLRKEIRNIEGKEGDVVGREKFIEYFQFLNHEFDMRHHLNPRFLEFYDVYRKNEFKNEAKYGNKSHQEWWDTLKVGRFTDEFKEYIDKTDEGPNQGSSADRKNHASAETGR